jgi:transposase-like protein
MAADYTPQTLLQAIRYYSDLDRCQDILVAARWPEGVTCPTCGSDSVVYLSTQKRWQCRGKHSRRQFSVKVGTIFEDSPIKLDKWFTAIWLITAAKNGISSYEIHRAIGVTQKTAWFMLHRIRLAMSSGSFAKLSGQVEVDETYVGGKVANMSKARKRRVGQNKGKSTGFAGKVAVLGLLERNTSGSRVRARVIKNNKKPVLQNAVREQVESGSTIYSDALASYTGLDGYGYDHDFIDHSEAYVRGQVHTNGLENFWSLLKRAIKGTYVAVDPVHLFRYVDEQAYRFNNRKDTDAGRFAGALDSVTGRRITYKELIGEQPA